MPTAGGTAGRGRLRRDRRAGRRLESRWRGPIASAAGDGALFALGALALLAAGLLALSGVARTVTADGVQHRG